MPKSGPGPLHGRLKAGKSVVYVVDRSASMGADGLLRSACTLVRASLSQLGPDTRFLVVAYNGGATSFGNQPITASPENVARASRWLDGLTAEGASDHRAGLREALWTHPDAVFLLTDADDLDGKEVRAIRGLIREPVFLSVAVFGAVRPASGTPLEQLVRELGGRVQYVGRQN